MAALKTLTSGWMTAGVLAAALLMAAPAAAAAPDPARAQALMEDVSDRVVAVLDEHTRDGEIDVERVKQEINGIVLPHLDLVTMTKLAVGRHWRDAEREQKRTLVTEFRNLLVRTYTTSLDEYGDQKLEFLPLRPSPYEDRVTVRSRVIRPDGPAIPVEYGMHFDDGEWLVYDIVVDGISLVTTYRSSFSSAIQNGGIEGLIEDLQQKNAAGETAPEITPGAS